MSIEKVGNERETHHQYKCYVQAQDVVRKCCSLPELSLVAAIMHCAVLPYFPPRCIYTILSPRGPHMLLSFQPFRTKFMTSEQEKCVQKLAEMFYTLIRCFELLFPENDQVWGRFLRFLTLNKSFGGWSPVCRSQQPSLLLT